MKGAARADLCVIGAGSGGLSVAAGAAQMGASVVLIEAGEMGGDCLNHGCVPSKALIAAAAHAQSLREGAAFGIGAVEPKVDFGAVAAHVAGVIAGIAPHDSQARFEGLGVRVIRARAAFVAPRVVRAGEAEITARRFVIATGSRPAVPPVPGLAAAGFLTNETVFGLRERPEHLLVLGGGAVGIELAQAYRRLGAKVSVIEADRALGREDPELAGVVLDRLRAEGVSIHEGVAVARVARRAGGIALDLADGRQVAGSHLLVAAGRAPNVEGLGLAEAGVRAGPRGIEVDGGLRTSNRRVFAIGDVAGQGQFTHLAGAQAGLVLRAALFGLPVRAAGLVVPRVLYTGPELAQVGLTEAEARALHGGRIEVIREPFAANDRARAEARTEGLVKLVLHRGRVVGAGIVGPEAGELIGLWTLAIGARLKLSRIAGMVMPYPTLSEISKRAAGVHFAPRIFGNRRVARLVRLVQRLP
ncbi:dihydrolipoyl dehydrogenase family protein [Amaricoccus sp. B4]|uniref:dihydrolipoyl dehydrogenase family protein n=1 Tax=Amaricoccus sp. B4 TaxID=3368557 RepID=UPI003717BFCE